MRKGLLAQFRTADDVIRAARELNDMGYRDLEVYSPYALPALDSILNRRPSRLPWWIFAGGLAGAGLGFGILWWTTAVDYPLDIGGFPVNPVPAFIPITFEICVLLASLTGFVGLFRACRLPKFYDPLFEKEVFLRVTSDRFFVELRDSDPWFEARKSAEDLVRVGGESVTTIGGEP